MENPVSFVRRHVGVLALVAVLTVGGLAGIPGAHAYAEPQGVGPDEPVCEGIDHQLYRVGEYIRVGDPDKGPIYVCGSDGQWHKVAMVASVPLLPFSLPAPVSTIASMP